MTDGGEEASNWWVFPGFEVEVAASGLDLPCNIAFVPEPSEIPGEPLLYITELYGKIKVISNDWQVHTYAENLLNYAPDHRFPGTGESGLIGICVEPETGDLFVSMIYEEKGGMMNKVARLTSRDGLRMESLETVLDGIPSVKAAHQIQAVTIGFDGKLYVNLGDGMINPGVAQDHDDLRGKILRLNLDGSIPEDNPYPNSLVFAKGMRNPFGAAWRRSDQSLYISDNGPERDDRIARVIAGGNYGWPETMRKNSIFWWHYTHAPTAVAFMQDGQFPDDFNDELFVCLFGSAHIRGPAIKGKKIVKIALNKQNTAVHSAEVFVAYKGQGFASPCGMAFGPGGLYFTDLFGEQKGGEEGPGQGSIYRVKRRT
ncbi:MAG: PQQ-dependent sugar dehydrogenase [Thermoleophilia bacterium]|nr:PQQ-dependent sugar dehydrogenase [Thermoleophilia bacterium]